MPASLRLLYAEDNPLDADLTRAHFESAAPDLQLDLVTTGEACLQAVAATPYDALLLDYRLADMDGLDVLRQVVRAGLTLPVVMVTGSGDEELVVQALRLGAHDYLPKTGDYLEGLPNLVRTLVSEHRQQSLSRTITLGPRRVLFVEHEPMDVDLTLTHFAEVAPQVTLVVAHSGREALRQLTGETHFDLVLTDLRVPDMSGLELLREARHRGLPVPFILITGKGDEDTAIAALKLGAYDYIVKRENYLAQLAHAVDHAIIRFQLNLANRHLRADLVALNNNLEQKVIARTAELEQEVAERRQRERELEAIVGVAGALRTAATRADMAPVVLDHLLTLLQADGATLEMVDPATGEMFVELGCGCWAATTQLRLPAGVGLSAQLARSGQPYLNNDALSDPQLLRPELLGEGWAVMGVPMTAQTHTIGVVWVARRAPLTEVDLRLLKAVSDIAANAINRAAFREQLERQVQQLASLRAIDQAISGSLELQVTLAIVLEQVLTHLQVDAAAVLLLNPHSLILECIAERGFRYAAVQRSTLRLGEGHAGRVAMTREIVHIPNLATTADGPLRTGILAQEAFVTYYGVPLITKGQVKGVLEVFHRAPLRPPSDWLDYLETLAGQTAIAIDSAQLFDSLQRSSLELALAYDATIEGWSHALDLRDKETEGHSQRVTEMTVRLARLVGLSDRAITDIRRGALLHDIGKMGLPDTILLKPGPLTEAEWDLMRMHPVYAYRMLSPIAYLRPALDIPYCHHEKWDGTGYPRGLRGEEIPLAARLFAVVDVWDALRSDRPYRLGWPAAKVREHIAALSGSHFEPAIAALFLKEVAPLPAA